MVKHIVMWQLKDESQGNSKQQNAEIIKERIEALNGKIDGLLKIEVGIDIQIPGNYDIVLVALFNDESALDHYQAHPLHQAITPFVKEASVTRHAVDYKY